MTKITKQKPTFVVEDLSIVEESVKIPSDYIKDMEGFLIHAETQEELTKLSNYIFPTPLANTVAGAVVGSYVKATAGYIKSVSKYMNCHIADVNEERPGSVLVSNRAAMQSTPKRKGFVHTIYIQSSLVTEASAANKMEREVNSDATRIHPAEREFLKFKREQKVHGLSEFRQKEMYKNFQDLGVYKKGQWAVIEDLALELCSKHPTYAGAIASGNITPYVMGKGEKERSVFMVYTPWVTKYVFDPMWNAGYIKYDASMKVTLQPMAEIKKRKLSDKQMANVMAFRKGYFFLEKEIHEFTEAEWSRIVSMPKQFVELDGTPLAVREEWRYYRVIGKLMDKHTARIASRMQMGQGYASLLAGTAATYLATRSVTAKKRGLVVQPILTDKDLHNEIRTLFRSYGDAAEAIDRMELQRARTAGEKIASGESYADHSSDDFIKHTGQRNYKLSEQEVMIGYEHLANKHFISWVTRKNIMEHNLTHNEDGSVKANISLMDHLDFLGYCEEYELAHFGRELKDIPVGSVIALYYRNLQRFHGVKPKKIDRTAGANVGTRYRIADLKAPAGWYARRDQEQVSFNRVYRLMKAGQDPMTVAQRVFERGGRWEYNSTGYDMWVLLYMGWLYEGGVLPIVHPDRGADGLVRVVRDK